jgi:AbrB family looped-hinge helix DNA binding protein
MITTIDANGRVQLPLTMRYWLNLNEGDELAVDHLGDGTIILKKIEGNGRIMEAAHAKAAIKGHVHG